MSARDLTNLPSEDWDRLDALVARFEQAWRAGPRPSLAEFLTVEPALRPAVLWRKNSFGCHRLEGCRFVERMLTVVQTLRLRKQSILGFLHPSVPGRPAPKRLLGQ